MILHPSFWRQAIVACLVWSAALLLFVAYWTGAWD